jgi:hypothetical protein
VLESLRIWKQSLDCEEETRNSNQKTFRENRGLHVEGVYSQSSDDSMGPQSFASARVTPDRIRIIRDDLHRSFKFGSFMYIDPSAS